VPFVREGSTGTLASRSEFGRANSSNRGEDVKPQPEFHRAQQQGECPVDCGLLHFVENPAV